MEDHADIEAMKAELADKKAHLAALDSGSVTLPPERIAAFRERVARLESEIRRRNAART